MSEHRESIVGWSEGNSTEVLQTKCKPAAIVVVVAVVAGRSRLSPLLAVTHAEEHDVVACRIYQRLAVGGGWWVRVVGGQGWSVDEVVSEGEWSARVGGESGGASGSGVQR